MCKCLLWPHQTPFFPVAADCWFSPPSQMLLAHLHSVAGVIASLKGQIDYFNTRPGVPGRTLPGPERSMPHSWTSIHGGADHAVGSKDNAY